MNKKFSTLVAVVLAATSFGATAQIAPTGDFAKYATANKPTEGMRTIEKGYFQLAVGSSIDEHILAMQPTSAGGYELVVVDGSVTGANAVEVRRTLWKAVISGNAEAGYSYQLQNVGTGEFLGVNTSDAIAVNKEGTAAWPATGDLTGKVVPVGSEVSVWKWVSAPSVVKTAGFEIGDAKGFTSAFGEKNDSTVVLVANAASIANDVKIAAVKYSLRNVPANDPTQLVKAIPVSPKEIVLGADDLNSLLWKQNPAADASKAEFTFTPNVINDETNVFGNLFTKNAYKAVPAVGFPAAVDVATNPFNGLGTSYDALYDAEIAYYQKAQEKAFIEKIASVVYGDDNKVATAKLAAVNAAITVITGDKSAIDLLTTPALIAKKIDGLTYSSTPADADQVKAVKEAAIAYVSGVHGKTAAEALTEAKGIADVTTGTAIAKKVNDFIAANITDGTAKTAVDAAIKTSYTDLLADGATLKTAITSAKNTLNTPVTGYYAKGVADNKWVSLMLEEAEKAEDNTYLSVACNFVTETANERERPLGFTTGKFADFGYTADPKARLDLNGRYNFQFTYFPNADSLVIRTGGWAKKNNAQTSWGDMNTTDNPELGVAAASPSATAPTAKGTENNIVKLIYLANNHSEITVGSSDYYIGAAPNTVNTRISIKKIDDEYVKTTLASGVYFFNLFSGKDANKAINGKYMVANFAGTELDWVNEETSKVFEGAVQDFGHMPRTQWVVSQNTGAAGIQTVNIYNREYPSYKAENVQLYKGGDGKVFALGYNNLLASANDTLSYALATTAKPNAGIATSETLGYKALDYDALIENIFSLKYFNGLNAGNFVEVSKDAAMAINPNTETADAVKFVFEPVLDKDGKAPAKNEFGFDGTVANVKNLYRIAYKVKLYNPGKEDLYLKANGKDGYELISETADVKGTSFFFKENNMLDVEGDTTCYYALVQEDLSTVSGVKHPSLILSVEEIDTENSVATFAFDEGLKPLYRRIGKTVADNLKDMAVDTAKFYMSNEPTRFLYENSVNRTAENGTEIAKDSLNFLGVINKADRPENSMLPIFIDTAYVRGETSMPQYMLALGVEYTPAGKYNTCPDKIENCHQHPTIDTKAFRTGRYLVALDDSAAVAPIKYQDKFRLAFVDAKHIEDTLVIVSSKYTGSEKFAGKDSIKLDNDKVLNAATFAFRIVDGSENGDFYIEAVKNADKKPQYVRVHNGVPVLVSEISEAAVFNITKTSEDPVANETIGTTTVSVIAGNGDITIKGAAGKKVAISNVLGQTIANTVLSSDDATISAPAGVVVVAVEGEAAVKAIVK
ncbi:DUF6383 domain-containing protein [Parabacteroides timonensis]|uniref:DUF6383 domain-containing protein n=1 Tax=Parabacteroides timonensis TaxID=1871013 RepID=UPI000ACC484D|nr:DUF6383 domain-containing protein [Parabacteroides timonensis]